MKEVRRAAIYVRCSTAEQQTDMQEAELLGILRPAWLEFYGVPG
jgi:DNA invertase Pin-like site-specific DNA recombinase